MGLFLAQPWRLTFFYNANVLRPLGPSHEAANHCFLHTQWSFNCMLWAIGIGTISLKLAQQFPSMDWYFGLLMAVIGAYILIAGLMKADHAPYKWLRARAAGIWNQNADAFLATAGGIIAILGTLAAMDIIW